MKKAAVFICMALMLASVCCIAPYTADRETEKLLNDENDPYGIKRFGRYFGFDGIGAPEYLPEGAVIDSMSHNVSDAPTIELSFMCDEASVGAHAEKYGQIIYTYFYENTDPDDYLVEYNYFELEDPIVVNGVDAFIVSTENTQADSDIYMTLYFKDNILMEMLTANIEYDEVCEILKSIK